MSARLRDLSRESGRKSVVLLKNEKQALPLSPSCRRIALIGALANSQKDMMGFWANEGVEKEVVTVYEGLKRRFPNVTVNYADGYDLETNDLRLSEARAAANRADVIVVAVGERFNQSGEAKSRADITVNANQQLLVKELKKTGKTVIVLLMGGRPMIFNDMEPHADAILLTWWLGTESGNAIADIISGDYNPSGKLPMTFPAHVGQIPVYYNYKSTGRPESKTVAYSCRYQDIDFEPAYPFGYGLSYTTFQLSEPKTSANVYTMEDTIRVSAKLKNTGVYRGKETVQLYIRDLVASVTRPVKELKGFQQIELNPGEEKEVTFILSSADLSFMNRNLKYITEPGKFEIMVGTNSKEVKKTIISLK